jgi:hypothetical protein
VNTARWDVWTPYRGGGVFYVNYNIGSYLNLTPKGVEEEDASGSTTLIVVIVVALVVAALVAWLALRGRGGRAEEA